MKELKITTIQSNLHWENKNSNLNMFSEKMNSISEKTNLIVLPEMFATGFSMNATKHFETMDGKCVEWMKENASNLKSALCGSLIIKENENYFNRFIWVDQNGKLSYYDKAHLFRIGEEDKHYTKGNRRVIIEYEGWKIAPFICYDLRFPVWMKRSEEFEYDMLLLVANWPERRNNHWKILTQARAIENQSYLVAVNRVGYDGHGINHTGDSTVYSPLGEIIIRRSEDESIDTVILNQQTLLDYRKSFPVYLDNDLFKLS